MDLYSRDYSQQIEEGAGVKDDGSVNQSEALEKLRSSYLECDTGDRAKKKPASGNLMG